MTKIKLYKNYLDIVILPPPVICDDAIFFSKELAKRFNGKFILGKRRFLPHISLYHVPIRNNNIPRVRKVLKEIVYHTEFGELSVKLEKTPAWGMIWLGVNNPPWLKRLHKKIVKAIEKFRDKRFRVEKTWGGKFSKLHYKNIQSYGSPFIGNAFYPHITLTSLKHEITAREIAEFIKSARFKPKQFKINSIFACRLGLSHTCHGIIFAVRK